MTFIRFRKRDLLFMTLESAYSAYNRPVTSTFVSAQISLDFTMVFRC